MKAFREYQSVASTDEVDVDESDGDELTPAIGNVNKHCLPIPITQILVLEVGSHYQDTATLPPALNVQLII